MAGRVLKEGHLLKAPDVSKYLHNPKKWQRKWFSLDNSGDLNFSDSDKSTKSSGVLQLWKCSHLFDPKTRAVQHNFCIGLKFSDFTTYLKAETAQSFNEWLRLFQRFVDQCELEELLESSRHSSMFSDQFKSRLGSTSSIQSQSITASMQANLQRKEGVMAKTGGNNKGWKDRYFVLDHGRLAYFKNEKNIHNDVPLGSISLLDCTNTTRTNGKRGFGFDLHTPSRVYNFSVDSEAELRGWMEVVSHNLEVLSGGKNLTPNVAKDFEKRLSTGSDVSSSSLDKILEETERRASATQSHSSQSTEDIQRSGSHGDKDGKDGVMQLLEAEVEVLRSKVSSLEADLLSSSSVNSQLQDQLVTERRDKDKVIRGLEQEKTDLNTQVEQLQRAKEELETINDSIQTQLEEQQERTQDLEEEQMAVKSELEEAQGSSNALEEELADTQTKLQEIEEVARNLEIALRKRSDSEPPADLSSLRSLNMSYKAKMTEEPTAQGNEEEDSIEVMELRTRIDSLESERDSLKQRVLELQNSAAVLEEPPNPETIAESLVNEERLKWQVEVVNIRRELDEKLDGERRGWREEREGLKAELARLRLELEESRSSHQQAGSLQTQLVKSHQRIAQLEGEVSSLSERVTELLAEKEKALADLNTIRKTNRNMEKKLSESEGRTNGRNSISSTGSSLDTASPPSPKDEGSRLLEAEKRCGELQARLVAVEKERDDLKRYVDDQLSTAPPPPPPVFNFFTKTSAAVGTSGQAVGGQALGPSPTALRNGLAGSTGDPSLPPPKPKKPPKELVDQFSHATNSEHSLKRQPLSLEEEAGGGGSPSIRSRTMSMFQTFFARR